MKKVLYGIFIFVISIMCVTVDAKTIYLQECEYTDEYKQWLKLSDEEKKDAIMPSVCKNDNHNNFVSVGNSASTLTGVSVNDSKFNLKDHSLVTNVKNQDITGSCWAFATNSSIESNLLMNGYEAYDLSEAHMELSTQNTVPYNRLTFNREINSGGHYLHSSVYLRNNWGSVLESTLPFNELVDMYELNEKNEVVGIIQSKIVSEDKLLNNASIVDVNSISKFGNSGKCENATINEIKEYLITNGALYSTMYFGNNSSYNLYQYYDGKAYGSVEANQPINHAISIVGWDDTISKDKFSNTGTPTRDGAFIIKNSYGTVEEKSLAELKEEAYSVEEIKTIFNNQGIYSASDIPDKDIIILLGVDEGQYTIDGDKLTLKVGNEGYQYVSYDDVKICNAPIGFFDADTEVEEYVYGYDELGYIGNYSSQTNTVYYANIFTKKSDGVEKLEEVNLYFEKADIRYEIYLNSGENKDINAAELIASGSSKFIGYNTIKIDDTIIESDKYTLIIKLIDDEPIKITLMANLTDEYKDTKYIEGVQFISEDGITFADVYNRFSDASFHLTVKAYTNSYKEVDEEIITPPEDDKKPEDEEKDDNTNDDGSIEILPSDMNNKNDKEENAGDASNDESREENPGTGDMITYTLIITFVIIGVGFISYRKLQKVKQHN